MRLSHPFHITIKAVIIALPTYSCAYITDKMVYTIPTLALTTFIATQIFNHDNSNARYNEDTETDQVEE